MTDTLRDRITKALSPYRYGHSFTSPEAVDYARVDAVIEALPEMHPDQIRAKYLKDWEEGYDEGYSAGGGGC